MPGGSDPLAHPRQPGLFSVNGEAILRYAITSAWVALMMTAVGVSNAAAPAARKRAPEPPAEKSAATYAFDFDVLLAEAKRLSSKPYTPRSSTLSGDLDKLSPEQYHAILFDRNAA